VGLPAVVFWETAWLVRKGRLDLGMSVREWAEKIQLIPRVEALPLTPEIAVLDQRISAALHKAGLE
jgi:PIN domain nuclease of toxin-antitoxin system